MNWLKTWQEKLEWVFGAAINQGPLEDGVREMVGMSVWKEEYHQQWLEMFEGARGLVREQDPLVIKCVNESGFRVSEFDEALSLIEELEVMYLEAYREAISSAGLPLTMHMKIKLVPGFVYAAGVPEFPIDIEISTEVPTEIYTRIFVTRALLTKAGDEAPSLGYSVNMLPPRGALVAFVPQDPVRMRADVFAEDRNAEGYVAGAYRCDITVVIEEKIGDKTRDVSLSESLDVVVG